MNYNSLTDVQKKIIKVLAQHPNIDKESIRSYLDESPYIIDTQITALTESQMLDVYKRKYPYKYSISKYFFEDNPFFKSYQVFEADIKESSQIGFHKKYSPTKKEKKILSYIKENPGISNKELAISLNMSQSALCNKLKILGEHYFLQSKKVGRNVYYFINDKLIEDNLLFDEKELTEELDDTTSEQRLLEQAKNEIQKETCDYDHDYIMSEKEKEILSYIKENPGVGNKELAVSLQVPNSTVSIKIKKLIEHHFLQSVKLGTRVYYFINDKLAEDNLFFGEDNCTEKLENEMCDYDHDYIITKKERIILSFIINNPGIGNKELAESLEMSKSALCNKIKILIEHHLIQSIKIQRNIYYFINDKFVEDNPLFGEEDFTEKLEDTISERSLLEQAKNEMQKKMCDYDHDYIITKKERIILSFIINNPGIGNKELAESLEMSKSALCNKTKILREHHLIQSIKIRKNIYYFINDKFVEDNPSYLVDKQDDEQNEKEDIKNTLSEELAISLIKNILFLSPSNDTKLLLDNFDFFQICFSVSELAHLLYSLDICKSESLTPLSKSKNEQLENSDEKELLIRYKETCLYLNKRYSNQDMKITHSKVKHNTRF